MYQYITLKRSSLELTEFALVKGLLGLGIESPERFTPGRSLLCNTNVVGIFATWPWPTVKRPGQVNIDPTSLFISQCGCIALDVSGFHVLEGCMILRIFSLYIGRAPTHRTARCVEKLCLRCPPRALSKKSTDLHRSVSQVPEDTTSEPSGKLGSGSQVGNTP